jgi:DNA-binding NarL/FixJ family response regulator
MISVLIADDQDLIRKGLRMLLEAEPDLRVAGEAADGSQALAQARRLDPDVILMDVRMPGLDGIQATAQLAQGGTRAKILMLTTFNLDEYVYHAMKAGASGFLLKDATREQLTGAIRAVCAGETLLAPAITRRLIEDFCRGPAPGDDTAVSRRPPERARTRGGAACRGGAVERRARGQSLPERGNHQKPHHPHPRQARAARPRADRRLRLRTRHRPARPRHSASRPENKPLA